MDDAGAAVRSGTREKPFAAMSCIVGASSRASCANEKTCGRKAKGAPLGLSAGERPRVRSRGSGRAASEHMQVGLSGGVRGELS